MYCYYKYSVALPHGAVGWSAVVIVVFSDHTHLLLFIALTKCFGFTKITLLSVQNICLVEIGFWVQPCSTQRI